MSGRADKCGLVTILGRPNVGKSTLLNHLLGQKLSITSRKPQTTRHSLLGVLTRGHCQTLFIDTPGLHRADGRTLNRHLNRKVSDALEGVDGVLMVVEARRKAEGDERVLKLLQGVTTVPVLLALNKVDRLADKAALLPRIAELAARFEFAGVFPLSALRGHNMDALQTAVEKLLPEAPHRFAADALTDRSERFLASEIIREKLVRTLGDELPHAAAVLVDGFACEDGRRRIDATVLVERKGQRGIVIGQRGARLKSLGTAARADMERLFGGPVVLKLWVKVQAGWSRDPAVLRTLD